MPTNGSKVPDLPTSTPGPASRPAAVFVPSLQARALVFHFEMMGGSCECVEDGSYPCEDCRDEIAELVELLDTVARDAIRLTAVWERVV